MSLVGDLISTVKSMIPDFVAGKDDTPRPAPAQTIFYGTFISLPRLPDSPASPTSPPKYRLAVNHGALWVRAKDGRIEGFDWTVHNEEDLRGLVRRMGWVVESELTDDEGADAVVTDEEVEIVRVVRARPEKNEFFFPGFIDTHIHAPQYPNSGIFGSSTLLDWLQKYTFPLESSFGNKEDPNKPPRKAYTVYNRVVSRTLSHGTTCASYFATIHVPATNLLASICHTRGQRAFVGRVCMDNAETCPDHCHDESASESIAATRSTVDYIQSLDPSRPHVRPIITPRFAASCSTEALSQLGELAASTTPPTHIQTHISENLDEVDLVHSLFPQCSSYADVYDQANLLTPRTILAHGVHLSSDERALIQSRGAGISHCPVSNSAMRSGLCPVRQLLDDGITVGLGTDVSGGYSPSILEVARQTCLVSRMIGYKKEHAQSGREVLGVEEALYLATRGGAAVIGMEDDVGGFERGMYWDAQIVGLGGVLGDEAGDGGSSGEGSDGPVDVFGWESWEEKVAKWMWTGDDRNVKAVWVGGELVHSRRGSG